jgi:transcriptional regulator with XRE-family HTH domain
MTIGQRLREKRREKKLTLKQLAETTELSLTYLSDIERDRARPSMKTLARVAQGLEVSVTDLMRGVDEWGEATDQALPEGLKDLLDDEEWGPQLDEDWLRTLSRVDYRGQRPATKQEWLELYLSLRRLIGDRRR